MLSHTTGLPYHAYTNLIEKGFDVRKIALQYIPGAPLSAKEGEVYSYQNAAFCIIEEVMRGKLHKSYQQLLQEDIFTPNGMSLASCDFESIQNIGNKALPHFWTGSFWRPDEISPLYYNAAAAGGVNASISDMGKWLKLLLGHRPAIANEVTLDRVFSPVVETGSERRIFRHWINRSDASYAMGWRVLNHHNDTIIYHFNDSGSILGVQNIAFDLGPDVNSKNDKFSEMIYIPTLDKLVVALSVDTLATPYYDIDFGIAVLNVATEGSLSLDTNLSKFQTNHLFLI